MALNPLPALRFGALADPTRCRIIEMLHEQSLPVHALSAAFAISRPAISRHLRVLKEAQLVDETRLGRENVYRLRRFQLRRLNAWLARHSESGSARSGTTKSRRENSKLGASGPEVHSARQLTFDL